MHIPRLPRLPDLRSLGAQLRLGAVLAVAGFGLAAVGAVWHLEERSYQELTSARLQSLADTIAVFGQGDAHSGLGTDPEARIGELAAFLGQVHERSAHADHLHTARTLRIDDEAAERVRAEPGMVHTGAVKVVACSTFDAAPQTTIDYRPSMAPALLDGESLTVVIRPEEGEGGEAYVAAYAPIRDSWGEAVAVAEVTTRFAPGLMRALVKGALAALVAGALGYGVLRLSFLHSGRIAESIDGATERAVALANGIVRPFVRPPHLTNEVSRLLDALDVLEAQFVDAGGPPPGPVGPAGAMPVPNRASQVAAPAAPAHMAVQPGAAAPPAPAVPPPSRVPIMERALPTLQESSLQEAPSAPVVTLPEASLPFELPLFVRQIVDSGRQRALQREIDLQVLFGDNVPSHLVGKPEGLYQALTSLLKNAFSSTHGGSIVVRVSRQTDVAGVVMLRFEVADTGSGIPWKEQPELQERLHRAVQDDPKKLREPLLRAAALSSQMGGELGFESQPGSGSRFWFTACFEPNQAAAAA